MEAKVACDSEEEMGACSKLAALTPLTSPQVPKDWAELVVQAAKPVRKERKPSLPG